MNSDSSARAIFCAKKNTGNLFTGDSEIPRVSEVLFSIILRASVLHKHPLNHVLNN